MTIKAFIFDLDGVITDTANYHYLAWKKLADEIHVPFDREKNEQLRGVSRRQSLLFLLDGKPVDESQLSEWMEKKNNFYCEYLKNVAPSDLLPGVLGVLKTLKDKRIKIAIASASKNAKDVLNRLGIEEYLDTVCDGYSVDNPKPAPDLFLYAAQQLEEEPTTCVVVEDAAAGIKAGISAGMPTVGIGPIARVGDADKVLVDGFKDVEFTQLFEELNHILR